jgi:hypothetical protein
MSKKNKHRKQLENKPQQPAKFVSGTPVRVKSGTTDPDFSDIPLGGWAGTIREVDQRAHSPTYLIEWTQKTLDQLHPVYRKRCERDGLEFEIMWLGEDDIESDTGALPIVEQPTAIHTRSLDPADQDDHIRAILSLASEDPLTEVTEETLRRYHSYLACRLSFPFAATFSAETGPLEDTTFPVTVFGLLDVDDCDDMCGLRCEARHDKRHLELPLGELQVKKDDPNHRFIEDYSYWFWNWG